MPGPLPATSSTRIVNPRLLCYTVFYDVAGDVCQALAHDAACPRCAPTPPSLQWSRKVGETKVSAREDPLQAVGPDRYCSL